MTSPPGVGQALEEIARDCPGLVLLNIDLGGETKALSQIGQ